MTKINKDSSGIGLSRSRSIKNPDDAVYEKIFAESLRHEQGDYTHTSYMYERELSQAIADGNLDTAIMAWEKSNSHGKVRFTEDQAQYYKIHLVIAVTIFTRATIMGGVDYKLAFLLSDACIRDIGQLKASDLADMEAYQAYEKELLVLFVKLVQRFQNEESKDYSPIVSSSRTYIRGNAIQKLSLNDIAASLNVHPNYLSNKFSKECGQSIMDYYNEKRTDLIKSYLLYTDYLILEIAEIFSFNSLPNFSSYFKNNTGMSPNEFRKKYKKATG